MNLGRLSVIIIAVIALFMALVPNSTVMGLVSYAWGGFGAAFGPLVLFGLYSKKTSWKAALSGMIVGTLTVIIWKQTGLGNTLYEIVPGFFLNVITILIVNAFSKPDETAETEFDEVLEEMKAIRAE